MKCRFCQAPIPSNSVSCFHCGRLQADAHHAMPSVAGPTIAVRPKSGSGAALALVTVAVVAMMAAGGAAFMLMRRSPAPNPAPEVRAPDPAPTAAPTGTPPPPPGDGTTPDSSKTAEIPGPTSSASVGEVGVAGGNVANASAVLARMRGRFRACYQAGLKSNPKLEGAVTLVAKIGPNGEVRSVSGGGGSLDPIVGCLKAVVSSGGFSPPEGGSAIISIPMTFAQQ